MPKRQIVIDLYDHTTDEEIAEIIEAMRGIGIDGARVVGDTKGGYVTDPDTAARVWTTDRALLAALGIEPS